MNYIQIQWTAPTIEEAREVAQGLCKSKLIACAQIIPRIESVYAWKGKVESSEEVKVLLKTQKEKFPLICAYLEEHASYDVPEITAVPLVDVSPAYRAWMNESLLGW